MNDARMGKPTVLAISVAAATLLAISRLSHPQPASLTLKITPARLPADGYSTATLRTNIPAGFSIVAGRRAARLEGDRLVAGVLGGPIVVEARAPGSAPARATLDTIPQQPRDFLRLDDPADRDAFTRWFTFLAESQYSAENVAAGIVDCAALVRFAYREALREHTGRWAGDLSLHGVPSIPGIRKYAYPYTPLGANLFRTADGFAEFADARTLIQHNTQFISRDLRGAAPGDLLFYRQLDQNQPFHLMVFLGGHVVYHTGPFHGGPGEIRRPAIEELRRHPAPQWRPHLGNPNFLGVYRWNLLCEPSTR